MSRALNATVADLARAKEMLAEGRLADAALLAEQLTHRRLPPYHVTENRRFQREAQVIIAVVAIRSGGAFNGEVESDSAEERLDAMEDALATLRKMDPAPQQLRELEGEALARLPGQQAGARTILEDLAKRDLLVAPEAWGALATLRARDAASGDVATAVATAKHTCLARAVRPAQCAAFVIVDAR